MINPSHIKYLSCTTTIIVLSLQIACEFGLDIKIGLMETQDGKGTDDCESEFKQPMVTVLSQPLTQTTFIRPCLNFNLQYVTQTLRLDELEYELASSCLP